MTKLKQLQESRTYYANLADCRALDDHEVSGPGFVYLKGSLYILIDDKEGSFYTIIGNEQPSSHRLEDIELELLEWAIGEAMI